jgi:hypothetical protein
MQLTFSSRLPLHPLVYPQVTQGLCNDEIEYNPRMYKDAH